MPLNPIRGKPHQPYVSPKLNAMLIRFTAIIEIAGVSVSPAPRRQALATNITVKNGSDTDSIRRYDSANAPASADSPVRRIQNVAQTYRTIAIATPSASAA